MTIRAKPLSADPSLAHETIPKRHLAPAPCESMGSDKFVKNVCRFSIKDCVLSSWTYASKEPCAKKSLAQTKSPYGEGNNPLRQNKKSLRAKHNVGITQQPQPNRPTLPPPPALPAHQNIKWRALYSKETSTHACRREHEA